MIKLITLLLLTTLSLFADSTKFAIEAGYETEYLTALKKAKQERKPLMFVMKTNTCPWCKKFERQTLKKEAVQKEVQNDYIPVTLYKSDKYPKKLEPKVVPTIFFVDYKDEEIFFTVKGYKPKKKFLKILEEAQEAYKK